MNRDKRDYLDDAEIIDFNEKIDAREAREMEEEEMPTSPLMFGPTGRGASPDIELKQPRVLYRDAAKALRNAGIDDSHLKDPTNLVLNEQQKEEAEEKQIDDMLDDMYREMMKPVAPRSKAKSPSQKKGGTRKRNKRSRRRNKRSTRSRGSRRSRRNKNRRR